MFERVGCVTLCMHASVVTKGFVANRFIAQHNVIGRIHFRQRLQRFHNGTSYFKLEYLDLTKGLYFLIDLIKKINAVRHKIAGPI